MGCTECRQGMQAQARGGQAGKSGMRWAMGCGALLALLPPTMVASLQPWRVLYRLGGP